MLVDARSLPADFELQADVCVIGAGPAGLTLAFELSQPHIRVCVIESGGESFVPAAQELSRVTPAVGAECDLDLSARTRRRQLGGTAHDWRVVLPWYGRGVRYMPLSESDFQERKWIPHSGWPFERSHLARYYERAQRLCGHSPLGYEPDPWECERAMRMTLPPSRVVTTMEHVGNARVFTRVLPRRVARSAHVTVLVNATAGAFEQRASAPSLVERVRLDLAGGRSGAVRASMFVLAAGAIENARLLLLSNETSSRGIGNDHGLVGRFYMDHHRVDIATWYPSDPRTFEQSGMYDLRRVNGSWVSGRLSLAEELRQKERLLHGAAYLIPQPAPHHTRALRSLQSLVSEVRHRRIPRSGGAWKSPLPGLPYIAKTGLGLAVRQRRLRPWTFVGWSGLRRNRSRFTSFMLQLQIELAPDPENRVLLASERDAFGRPRAAIRWKWGELDRRSLETTRRMLAATIMDAGLGVVVLPDLGDPPQVASPEGVHHQLGTTRMHRSASQGVVDPDCRVHGVDNLFIAGSSVFPTGGYANPMLTIIALTMRLADHLKERMRARSTLS